MAWRISCHSPLPVTGAPADIWQVRGRPRAISTPRGPADQSGVLTTNIPMNDPAKAFLRGIEISWQTQFMVSSRILSGAFSIERLVHEFTATVSSFAQCKSRYNPDLSTILSIQRWQDRYKTNPSNVQTRSSDGTIWDSAPGSPPIQELTLTNMDTQFGLENSYYDNVLLFDICASSTNYRNLSVLRMRQISTVHIDNILFFTSGVHHASGGPNSDKRTDVRMGGTAWGQLYLLEEGIKLGGCGPESYEKSFRKNHLTTRMNAKAVRKPNGAGLQGRQTRKLCCCNRILRNHSR